MSGGIHDMLYEFISDYDNKTKEKLKDNPLAALVRKKITLEIQAKINDNIYKVTGSVGQGGWADVPWIAVLDSRITDSAEREIYIVYLLNKDTKELYLTLNQGVTDIADAGNEKKSVFLKKRAAIIRDSIVTPKGFSTEEINTKKYKEGCIFQRKYTLESLPEDDEIYSDLKKLLNAYQDYYDKIYKKQEFVSEKKEGMEEKLHRKEQLEKIASFIKAKGFKYDGSVLKNFYLSLKTKPFVLLAGISGTGKTRLVRLFAEAIGVSYESGRYKQVAVKPDWSDPTDLFGHVNLDNKFVPGTIIEFIKKAADDPDKLPYILCLDEMNLARVEYYFSDFLSIMETRAWGNNEIVTDKLVPKSCYSGDAEAEKLYADLMIPENLYIVGTVNMDETTFPFSKKVLDRANTIEFSYVDFNDLDVISGKEVEAIEVNNDFLRANYLRLRTDCVDYWESVKKINEMIVEINDILEKGDAHFGYRVRDEIVFYMLYNEALGLLSEEKAFDNQIMQKILPRIQGSSESTANILRELFIFCAGSFSGKNGQTDGRKMESYLADNGSTNYPKSALKICKMLRRYEEDDYTSFWV